MDFTWLPLTLVCVGRGKRPSRSRRDWRVELHKAARSVGVSHSVRIPASTTTGPDRRWVATAKHGCTEDLGLFAPQSTCPGSSWRQGSHLP